MRASGGTDDHGLISAINSRTGAGLAFTGRAETGKAGGAVFAEWPDGRPAVVTMFLGGISDAERVADVLNRLQDQGLPVPRHELVVNLDHRVAFVQERLPKGRPGKLSPERIDQIVEINERFAGVLGNLPDVPPVANWFQKDGDPRRIADLIPPHDRRAHEVLREMIRLATRTSNAETLAGSDLVHVDLSAANVLFDDEGSATAVVDWNLGAYRGDRRLALVQTRFDREWFVQSPNPEPSQIAAARHLDEILTTRIPPDTLRIYWAHWLLHQLPKALRNGSATVIDWQLSMAEGRLR